MLKNVKIGMKQVAVGAFGTSPRPKCLVFRAWFAHYRQILPGSDGVQPLMPFYSEVWRCRCSLLVSDSPADSIARSGDDSFNWLHASFSREIVHGSWSWLCMTDQRDFRILSGRAEIANGISSANTLAPREPPIIKILQWLFLMWL